MKKLFTTLFLLLVSLTYSYAELPPPLEFKMIYEYFRIGQSGFCGEDTYVIGPTHCTSFLWREPEGDQKPIEYKVYYKPFFQEPSTIEVLHTTSDTDFKMEVGIVGEVWVTAVYESGESEPSNVEENRDLALSIEQIKESDDNLYYDILTGNIVINNKKNVKSLTIVDNLGRVVEMIQNPRREINITNYVDGTYVIITESVDSEVNIIKILKK